MAKMRRLYIAYGSNLNKDQMVYRCPGARPVAKSWLPDHRLVFQGLPQNAHANVIPEKGCAVPVVVWEITKKDEMSLDRYEGVKGGYYTKEYYTIDVDGKMEIALIYIMAPNPYGMPSAYYMNVLEQGYKDFGFDARILNTAVIHSYRNANIKRAQ